MNTQDELVHKFVKWLAGRTGSKRFEVSPDYKRAKDYA